MRWQVVATRTGEIARCESGTVGCEDLSMFPRGPMEDADSYEDGSQMEEKIESQKNSQCLRAWETLNTPSKTRSRGDEIASVRGYNGKKNDLEKQIRGGERQLPKRKL